VLFGSSAGSTFRGNSFVGNLSPLALDGRRTDAVFHGNYWSDHTSPDLDGDGFADRPYRLSSLFDHLRGNLAAADLMSRSLTASAVAAAEQALPVLEITDVADDAPLARPPALAVPVAWRDPSRARTPAGMLTSIGLLSCGALLLMRGRRRHAPGRREGAVA
jgi:nitrous oxidase accessory protein